MSILTGFKKVKNYILTSSGYQLLSRWTSSQTVEFDDGKTAQAKLGEINGIAKTYVDMKKATDNSMAVSAKAVMEGLENSSALISMTQAEYDALSDEEKTDNNMRAILDANPDVVDAKNVNFDNTNTNLIATNTQSAITELNGKLSLYTYGDKVYGSSSATISPASWSAQWISIVIPDGYSFFTAICCSNNDVVCGVSAANYDSDNSRVLVNAYNRHTQARDFSHVYIVPIFIRD